MATPDILGPEAAATNTSDQAWLSLLGRLSGLDAAGLPPIQQVGSR